MATSEQPRRIRFSGRSPTHQYGFVPKDDITTSELSACVEMLLACVSTGIGSMPPRMLDAQFASLPPEAQRHFAAIPLPKIVVPGKG